MSQGLNLVTLCHLFSTVRRACQMLKVMQVYLINFERGDSSSIYVTKFKSLLYVAVQALMLEELWAG